MGADDDQFSYSPVYKVKNFLRALVEGPGNWFRENVLEPNRQLSYWYHEKIQRVPTVDECYTDDDICIYEANTQYLRDKLVDKYIVDILRRRYNFCWMRNVINKEEECAPLKEDWVNASTNFFIKYGELGVRNHAIGCLMKQKHRMAWERRHGPVGSGKKEEKEDIPRKKKTC